MILLPTCIGIGSFHHRDGRCQPCLSHGHSRSASRAVYSRGQSSPDGLVPAVMALVSIVLLYFSSAKHKIYAFNYDVYSITRFHRKGKHIVKNFHCRTAHVLYMATHDFHHTRHLLYRACAAAPVQKPSFEAGFCDEGTSAMSWDGSFPFSGVDEAMMSVESCTLGQLLGRG